MTATVTCTRRIQFCAGHRLLNHEGKCASIHGHNYVALFTARAGTLDPLGRVIDFAVLKERLGNWIEEQWDHGFLVNAEDEQMIAVLKEQRQKHFVMPANPTAENIALYLLRELSPAALEGTGVEITSVRVWETENCFAEATL